MDNPEERLSEPVAEEVGQTVEIPTSPHGSTASRRSSSQGSIRSSHSSPKPGYRQKTIACRKYCSTVLACLVVGVMITLGSMAMTVIGYFALSIASETVKSGNSTTVVLDEQLQENLYKFRTFGPVMIGFGSFLIMCSCVLLCEEKDKKNKARSQASENLLSEHERIMQQARERFYNENRNAVIVESQTGDNRTPKASSNELTSCLDCEMVGNSVITCVQPIASSATESDNASGASGSPVVLVHGPTVVEPAQCVAGDKNQCTGENEVGDNSPSNSNHSSPDHKFGSPSRNFKKNNSVRPASIEDTGCSGLVLPISPVLPKIRSPLSGNGISRAGGAIPKSILVQPMKLSPIRSVNGPIRVRLDHSPTELSPISPSSTSKSAECLPQPRSPVSTSGRVKRGKKKKLAGGLEAGSLGECRCLSDPSMASMRSPDRQLDACCCLQPGCCWGGNCQLDKSMSPLLTNTAKSADDPLAVLVATGDKTNSPLLPPLNKDTNVNAQSMELKPKSLDKLGAADQDSHASKQAAALQETHLLPQNVESRITNEDQGTARDVPPPQGTSSPSRQVSNTNECSSSSSSSGGGVNATTGETNTDTLVTKDRNSNITVSSNRQDTTPGKSAPYSGQTKGGVMV